MTETTATQEHPSSAQGGLFSFDPGLSIWSWVIFALLFVVLRKYAWAPLMQSVKEREKVMAGAVEDARRTREELEKIADRQREMIAEAQAQSRQIVENSRAQADEAARSITSRALEQAQKTATAAQAQIEIEKEKALADIRSEAVDIVVKAAGSLIGKTLDDKGHRLLAQQQLDQL